MNGGIQYSRKQRPPLFPRVLLCMLSSIEMSKSTTSSKMSPISNSSSPGGVPSPVTKYCNSIQQAIL